MEINGVAPTLKAAPLMGSKHRGYLVAARTRGRDQNRSVCLRLQIQREAADIIEALVPIGIELLHPLVGDDDFAGIDEAKGVRCIGSALTRAG